MKNDFMQTESKIIDVLRTIYDPEIPVNIYDLGLIYRIDVDDNNNVDVDMTLTAPNCPIADTIFTDVRTKIEGIAGIGTVKVNTVFEPAWNMDMISEEARVELGLD